MAISCGTFDELLTLECFRCLLLCSCREKVSCKWWRKPNRTSKSWWGDWIDSWNPCFTRQLPNQYDLFMSKADNATFSVSNVFFYTHNAVLLPKILLAFHPPNSLPRGAHSRYTCSKQSTYLHSVWLLEILVSKSTTFSVACYLIPKRG